MGDDVACPVPKPLCIAASPPPSTGHAPSFFALPHHLELQSDPPVPLRAQVALAIRPPAELVPRARRSGRAGLVVVRPPDGRGQMDVLTAAPFAMAPVAQVRPGAESTGAAVRPKF